MDVHDNTTAESELNKFISEGGSLAMLKNISGDELEKIYAVACDFYESGKYPDAESLFQVLCILNHYDTRFFWRWAPAVSSRRVITRRWKPTAMLR